jgi:hypothetical protein
MIGDKLDEIFPGHGIDPTEREQDRRENSDLCERRQQADKAGAKSHQQKRDHHDRPAAVTIADMTENNAPERTD